MGSWGAGGGCVEGSGVVMLGWGLGLLCMPCNSPLRTCQPCFDKWENAGWKASTSCACLALPPAATPAKLRQSRKDALAPQGLMPDFEAST